MATNNRYFVVYPIIWTEYTPKLHTLHFVLFIFTYPIYTTFKHYLSKGEIMKEKYAVNIHNVIKTFIN